MFTVDPPATVLLAEGVCCHTVPGAVPAGPAAVIWFTLKPSFCSSVTALVAGTPTTFGTLDPPETKMVTLEPGATLVPPTGLWLTTVPDGSVDVVSVCTETWKPAVCRVVWATFCSLPSTLGTATGAA